MAKESRPALSRGRIRFPDISPRAYEHPADRGALVALRAIPGFDSVLKVISGAIGERSVRLLYLATSIRVSPRQYPEIHHLLNECASGTMSALITREPSMSYWAAKSTWSSSGGAGSS